MLLFMTVLLISIANCALIGSASDEDKKEPPYINLVDEAGELYQASSEYYNADGNHVDSEGYARWGEIYIEFNTECDIYLEEFVDGQWREFGFSETWLYVYKEGPWGKSRLDITVYRNDGPVDRQARIKITASHPDIDITRYVYITQSRRTWPSMGLSEFSLTAPPTGDSFEVTLTMRGTWDAVAESGLVVHKGDYKFTLVALPNTSDSFTPRVMRVDVTSPTEQAPDDQIIVTQAPILALDSYSWAPGRSEERSTKVVKVAAPDSEPWSVLEDETSSWLEVTPAADNKSFSVRMKEKNPSEEPRDGTVVIQSSYGSLTREFKVTQLGKPILRLGTDETWYPTSSSTSKTFQVIADGITWEASVSDWLKLGEVKGGNGPAEITVTVDPTSLSRDNGEIRIEGIDIYGDSLSDSIAVEQYLSDNVIDVSNSSVTSGDNWRLENGVFYVSGDATLTGSSSGNRVVIGGGTSARPHLVTIQNLTISSQSGSPIQLGSGAHVILVLSDNNSLSGNGIYAGLSTTGANLTIRAGRGSASLTATAWDGAAIGGNGGNRGAQSGRLAGGRGDDGSSGGNITIEGGNITATSTYGAGIGGGKAGNGGYGDTVYAGGNGGNGGAGANLSIHGGVITARSTHSAAIGGGRYGSGGDTDLSDANNGDDGSTGSLGYITLPQNYIFQLGGDGVDRRPPEERFSLNNAHRHIKINAALSLFRNHYNIPGTKHTVEVEVLVNNAWSVTKVQSSNGDTGWMEIVPMEGNTAGILTITADNNNTGAVRDGFVTVSCNGMEETVTIVQPYIRETTVEETMPVSIQEPDQQVAFAFTPQRRRMYAVTAREFGNDQPEITLYDDGNEALGIGETEVVYMFEAGETYYILAGLADEATGEYQLSIDPYYEQWSAGKNYTAGEMLEYGTDANGSPVLYIVFQNHTSAAHWLPSAATSLYKKIEIPEWTQPLNAIDAYMAGEKVMYKGKRWISEIDGNVWAPGTHGWKIFE